MPALPLSRSLRRTACAAALLAALTGCGSDGLDVEGFAAGACTDAGSTLQDVDQALRELTDEDLAPGEAAAQLRAAQDALKPVVESAGEVAEPVQELITRIGFFRIAVDSNGSVAGPADDVRTALDGLVQTCRA